MREIERVDVLSVAKLYAALAAVVSLVFILPWMLIAGGAGVGMGNMGGTETGMLMAMGVLMPVFYVVAAFVGGALFGWLYNVLAGRLGGIEVELSPAEGAHAEPETPAGQPGSGI